MTLTRRATSAIETKFVIRKIENWIHPEGKLFLLGESAHPQIVSILVSKHADRVLTLVSLRKVSSTHSGSLAVEDAAVLGDLFSRLRSREQIVPFLYGYQELRAERCWQIQQSESANSQSVMLPDGPAQEERDRSMQLAYTQGSGGWDETMFRHLWEAIRILFAYDPQEVCQEWWLQWGMLRERADEMRGELEKRERARLRNRTRPKVGRAAKMPVAVTMMESEAEGEEAMVSETTSFMAMAMSPMPSLTPPIRLDKMPLVSH